MGDTRNMHTNEDYKLSILTELIKISSKLINNENIEDYDAREKALTSLYDSSETIRKSQL